MVLSQYRRVLKPGAIPGVSVYFNVAAEWKTGLDFAREFDKHILQDNLDFDKILEEANNMQRAYNEVEDRCMIPDVTMEEGGYIMFVTPLMWSHAEYMKALLYKHGLYSNGSL